MELLKNHLNYCNVLAIAVRYGALRQYTHWYQVACIWRASCSPYESTKIMLVDRALKKGAIHVLGTMSRGDSYLIAQKMSTEEFLYLLHLESMTQERRSILRQFKILEEVTSPVQLVLWWRSLGENRIGWYLFLLWLVMLPGILELCRKYLDIILHGVHWKPTGTSDHFALEIWFG